MKKRNENNNKITEKQTLCCESGSHLNPLQQKINPKKAKEKIKKEIRPDIGSYY